MQATSSRPLRHVTAGDVRMAVVCDGVLCCDGDFVVRRLVMSSTHYVLSNVSGEPLERFSAAKATIKR